ncbi:translation initiation factor 2 [Streptomyces sp. NPDC048172]|uniref:translation initiation factor 2 n=1 Tax=Streptomyces sp. NPDC048172 TaxID=3365505 RepID=UPI00371880F2
MHRLLDVFPALSGDSRIARFFALVPGSEFGADALTLIDTVGGRLIPWHEACERSYDLVVSASPKGDLHLLRGKRVLLPHGAGFNKALPWEGSSDSASGLDPLFLEQTDDAAPIALHAVSHPDQISRLASVAPRAAQKAKVTGDPTLDRVLAANSSRDRYRGAMRTGPRKLLALTSTWGPDSLLWRRPELPAQLVAQLPYDDYQVALIVHPNEWSRLGEYELHEWLAPALEGGMLLPDPRDEWASVLVAADALITDHGSTALYYAAVQDRPLVGAGGGTSELIRDSPMEVLLSRIPQLGDAGSVVSALAAYRPGAATAAARAAFAHQGDALGRIRTELYALLGLDPPHFTCTVRELPSPRPASRVPTAFDVHIESAPDGIRVARHPAGTGPPGHHLAVEEGAATERFARSADLLYRRPLPQPCATAGLAWSSDGWTRWALSEHPACRSAAAVLPSGVCLLRVRGREAPYAVEAEPRSVNGRIARIDPAAALSAVHAWLVSRRAGPGPGPGPDAPSRLTCVIGDGAFPVQLRPATSEEATQAV